MYWTGQSGRDELKTIPANPYDGEKPEKKSSCNGWMIPLWLYGE